MIERLLERLPLGEAEMVALDSDPSHQALAAARLEAWASAHHAVWAAQPDGSWRIEAPGSRLVLRWLTASLFDEAVAAGPFDALLAHAVLDLVDLEQALTRMVPRVRPGGLLYFTLNFDGLTAFLPEIDPELDRTIIDAYHATMDARRDGSLPSGSSRTGRRLLAQLPRHGAQIHAAGASDWIVFPGQNGYRDGESVVLETMLGFVEESLRADASIEQGALARWVAGRRAQLRDRRLILVAHQIDVLARAGA